jgi:hypothetical protein
MPDEGKSSMPAKDMQKFPKDLLGFSGGRILDMYSKELLP